MKVIIDRFEESFAVCEKENREMINIDKGNIPSGAKEGDVLNIERDLVSIDIGETEKRKKQIEYITKDLWK